MGISLRIFARDMVARNEPIVVEINRQRGEQVEIIRLKPIENGQLLMGFASVSHGNERS
jgi:hypothetical protein